MTAFLIIGISALSLSGWYVYRWDLFFNSDFAMIGLIAKRIMETGEQFIFVPKVGYQGLLIEGNLGAFLFRWFGISPPILHLTAALCFLVLVFCFYHAVKEWFSKDVALVAGSLLCFSSPLFFGNVLRTQPNYPETFFLGCLLFWIYGKNVKEERDYQYVLLGLISGFGFYLYGQIIYFVAAIVGSQLWRWSARLDKTTLRWPTWFQGLFGIGITLSLLPSLKIFQLKIPGPTILLVSVLFYCLSLSFRARGLIKEALARDKKKPLLFVLAFLVGYSPTLYYKLVTGGKTISGLAFIKFSEELGQNLLFFIKAFPVFAFGMEPRWVCNILSGLILIGTTTKFVQELKKPRGEILNPFWLMGTIVIGATLFSRSVYNLFCMRYTLAWQLVASIFIAQLFFQFKARAPSKAYLGLIAFFGFRLFTHFLAPGQYHNYTEQLIGWKDVEPVVAYLKETRIKKGYGDYWVAYLSSFVTNGEIIIEPLYTNYLSFYEEEVKRENQIALIKRGTQTWYGPEIPTNSNKIAIGENTYQIKSSKELFPWTIWILERQNVL